MKNKAYQYMDWPRIEAIVYGEENAPRDVMAPRKVDEGILVQGFFPEAVSVWAVWEEQAYEMKQQDEAGYFAEILPFSRIPEYAFRIEKRDGSVEVERDPYAYACQITEKDEKAFLAGIHYHIYEKLGSHPMLFDNTEGTYFAVWAPNAVRVSVVGDFNHWDGRHHPMHRMPMSGIYELFVPGVKPGDLYKYEIKIKGGGLCLKADPYASRFEAAPGSASVVPDTALYQWKDENWMLNRDIRNRTDRPICIYETALSKWWKEGDSFREIGHKLLSYVKNTGYTHVELHPVMEYLDEASGGYDTFGYYAPTARYGSSHDLKAMIDSFHQSGVGVILDWTPAHFPRHEAGLERFDGTPLYEVKEASMAVHPKWGTLLYNYDSPLVRNFLIANALYWLEEFHADGLRMDDVDSMLYLDYGREESSWVPNMYGTNENLYAIEFLKHLNSIAKKHFPGILLIAQEDGLWPQLTDSVENDHIGFDYKWNSGWTADLLEYLSKDPIERQYYHDTLTLSMLYAYCESYILTLGSRDVGSTEEFMNKIPGTEEHKRATVRLAYAYLILHPGRKMLSPDAQQSPGAERYLQELLKLYKNSPALYELDEDTEGFEWIQLMNAQENVISFLRKAAGETLLVICNFAAVPYIHYKIGVPFAGIYREIFNTDAARFGGSGVTNPKARTAVKEECDDREYLITVKLPALSCVVFGCTEENREPVYA
ncbi:MAG: 1,4-alpha-glucan branching enzyme [Eubacteriales bacterium]|nr:1,4-alpha-glucan branching enzyme [Eubacteriales bacterium]